MISKQAPPLNAPTSSTAVKVSAIDTTLWLVTVPCDIMYDPPIKGFDRLKCGTWSFHIEHPSGRKLLYDLGCRKDWENLPPALGLEKMVGEGYLGLEVEKNVSEILTEGGVRLEEIEGVIWSHWHFDHTGDPSTFPPSTKLIVGSGFKAAFLPGYPTDPNGHVLESDFKGRELMELDFSKSSIQIGRFKALDYFGDGSFYILDSPGHAIGHVNALARTHTDPPGFIHLGGDSIHHAAEIRPTEYLPLPSNIEPSPLPHIYPNACPGHIFTPLLRDGSTTKHILEFQDPFKGLVSEQKYSIIYDDPALRETVTKDEELDAREDVFTFAAHDWSLKGVVGEWPGASLNGWREKGWKEQTRWKFLEDFGGAVG